VSGRRRVPFPAKGMTAFIESGHSEVGSTAPDYKACRAGKVGLVEMGVRREEIVMVTGRIVLAAVILTACTG
jgi:hypothetical protein